MIKELKLVFLFIFLGLLLALGGTYTVFAYQYSNKVLPGIKYEGKSLAGLRENELKKLLKSFSLSQKKVTLIAENKVVETSLEKLGVSFDSEALAPEIIKTGRGWKSLPKVSFLAKSLFKSTNFLPNWSIDNGSLTNFIGKSFGEFEVLPESAYFSYENKVLLLKPEKEGRKADLEAVKNQLPETIEKGSAIVLSFIPLFPEITATELEPYKKEIEQIISRPFLITAGSRQFRPKPAEILGWLTLNQPDEEGIKAYVETIAQKTNRKAKDRKVSQNGESIIVLAEGQEGISLNEKEAVEKIKTAITSTDNKIFLSVKTTPPGETTITPGFTPGKYEGKYIEINLSEQRLYRFEGSNLIASHQVSTGKWSMPTPIGEFTINNKVGRAYSRRYNLYMPFWMSFVGSEYGIHELPEWPDGTKEGQGHLGTPVSHGCVRLGVGEAEETYNWAEIGTPVYVHK